MWSDENTPASGESGGGNSDWVETIDSDDFQPESSSDQSDESWIGRTGSESDESGPENEYDDLTEDIGALDSMPDGDDGSSNDNIGSNDWG